MGSVIRRYVEQFSKYLRPQLWRVVALFIAVVASIGAQLFVPQILRSFIDQATSGAPLRDLVRLAILVLVVGLGRHAIDVVGTYFRTKVGWTATNQLRRDLFGHALRLGMAFHQDHRPGEMIERIDGDVGKMEEFFSQLTTQVFANGLLLIGILVALFRESTGVGFALIGFMAVCALAARRLQGIAIPHWKQEREQSAEFFGFLEDRMTGTESIKSSGAVDYVMRLFDAITRRWFRKERKAFVMGMMMGTIMSALFDFGIALGLALGSLLFMRDAISIGTVYLIFEYTMMLTSPLDRIMMQIEQLQRARASIERIDEILNSDQIMSDSGHRELPDGPLRVEFRNVSFEYVDNVPVLHDVSFSLPPKRILGILGRTGSGKSTISRLLFRLYEVQSGSVLVGGVPTPEVALDELRRRIGMVTQNVDLVRGSIRDNLTLFDEDANDEQIMSVLDRLGLASWFESLENGLDTELSAEGRGLSDGEAQLLAFGRIFLCGDPGVIVLDEASSRLDPATEARIGRIVRELAADRTMIIIAHRLATVMRADDIMIVEDGRVVEFGERESLRADTSSRFYRFLQTGMEDILA